ncbi:MAG TPA: FapA family protein [Candidatus Hydrogenedentes bacterium]|nr:FapA family protein [Candidatus Hydrogenedentota bacterium]
MEGNQPTGDPVLTVRLSDNRARVLVDCSARKGEEETLVLQLRDELVRLGLGDTASEEAATTAFREALSRVEGTRISLESVTVLRGEEPTDPVDAHLEWTDNFFDQSFVVDEATGQINYRERAGKLSVVTGQKLAELVPAVEGTPGRDVYNKPIPPRKPKTLNLRLGPGVQFDETTRTYTATTSGRLRYSGGILAVDNVLVIDAVDLASGNIHHPGMLSVMQNIESGCVVETEGDIEVNGYVENSEIRCGGTLSVRGGIIGGCTVRANGDVHARFLQQVEVRALGSVVVEREIANARVWARGKVNVLRGRIVGGEVTGHGGVYMDQAGSDAAVLTDIIAGEDFYWKEQSDPLHREARELEDTLERIMEKLDPFLHKGARVPDAAKAAVKQLLEKTGQIKERLREIEQTLEMLWEESQAIRVNEIIARVKICPNARFRVLGLTLRATEEVPGPVKVGIAEGDIHFIETKLKR